MIEKLKNIFAYATLTLLVIILTSCADSALPVKIVYEDDNLQSSYSSKGGLDVALKGYKKDGVEGFYSEDEGLQFTIDKSSNK